MLLMMNKAIYYFGAPRAAFHLNPLMSFQCLLWELLPWELLISKKNNLQCIKISFKSSKFHNFCEKNLNFNSIIDIYLVIISCSCRLKKILSTYHSPIRRSARNPDTFHLQRDPNRHQGNLGPTVPGWTANRNETSRWQSSLDSAPEEPVQARCSP